MSLLQTENGTSSLWEQSIKPCAFTKNSNAISVQND